MKLTYLGHAGFKLALPGSTLLIDPFLSGNPLFEQSGLTPADVAAGVTHILLTHGHEDHVGDTLALAEQTGATVVGMVELITLLKGAGVAQTSMHNLGGAYHGPDFTCTFVRADHSSSWRGQYAGLAAGIVLQAEGLPTLYHMGDTDIFADMALIQERFQPQIGLVPIGGHFTMDPPTAAEACNKYMKFQQVVPIHYKTFPVLAPTAEEFVAQLKHGTAEVLQAGDVLHLSTCAAATARVS